MEFAIGRWFRHTAALREVARREVDVGRRIHELESHVANLQSENESLREKLATEESRNRVQAAEIECLASVCERNLARVRAEMAIVNPESRDVR